MGLVTAHGRCNGADPALKGTVWSSDYLPPASANNGQIGWQDSSHEVTNQL